MRQTLALLMLPILADLSRKSRPKHFPRGRAVRNALIEFRVPLKQQGKRGRRPAQAPCGHRRSGGMLAPHLGQQRVVQSVRKVSKDGLSYRQIFDFLTSVGVPTKNQGKGWQPEIISRVLTRDAIGHAMAYCDGQQTSLFRLTAGIAVNVCTNSRYRLLAQTMNGWTDRQNEGMVRLTDPSGSSDRAS